MLTLSRAQTLKVAWERLHVLDATDGWMTSDLETDLADHTQRFGSVAIGELDRFQEELRLARSAMEALIPPSSFGATSTDRDKTEGEAARVLYRALDSSTIPEAAYANPGFWRWLTMAYCWNFTVWRESGAFEPEFGASRGGSVRRRRSPAFAEYLDGKLRDRCVAHRLYLRARCLGGERHLHLTDAVREGTDFWQSMILSGIVGEYPFAVQRLVELQSDEATRMTTNELRPFAKDLRRTLYNFELLLLAKAEQRDFIAELWSKYRPLPPSA